jgi:putative ABC transport system permease protein
MEYEGVTLDKLDVPLYGSPDLNAVYEINKTLVKINALTQSIKGFSGRLVFTNYTKAKEILNTTPGRCSAILIKLREAVDPKGARTVISSVLPDAEVLTRSELSRKTRLYYVKNTGMGGSFGFSTMVGALVGIIIITLTMYTGVLQRQKDFAVLRALGARKIDILMIVLCQSLIIGVAGTFIGFLLLSGFLSGTLDTSLPSYMPRWVSPLLAVGTIALCVGGSLLAIRKAISIEPASVFR